MALPRKNSVLKMSIVYSYNGKTFSSVSAIRRYIHEQKSPGAQLLNLLKRDFSYVITRWLTLDDWMALAFMNRKFYNAIIRPHIGESMARGVDALWPTISNYIPSLGDSHKITVLCIYNYTANEYITTTPRMLYVQCLQMFECGRWMPKDRIELYGQARPIVYYLGRTPNEVFVIRRFADEHYTSTKRNPDYRKLPMTVYQ